MTKRPKRFDHESTGTFCFQYVIKDSFLSLKLLEHHLLQLVQA